MIPRYINPNSAASVPKDGGGTYVGTVTSVSGNSVYVEIPLVAPGQSFGPCLVGGGKPQLSVTKQTISTGSGSVEVVTGVSMTVAVPTVGSRVLCAFIDNRLEEVVVLGSVT